MIKVVDPSSWPTLGSAGATLIKRSSRGLLGEDYRQLVKASSDEFAHFAKDVQLSPGQIPVHLTAMGSTEFFGSNRNGDGFKEATLRSRSYLFEKMARWYRHHKNKDKAKSYGVVKLARYVEPMHRTELLVALNGDEKTAQENGGLVADEEQEKLARGDDLAASMACSVDHDVCSVCGHKSRTRHDYCEPKEKGGSCAGFGCKDGLTRVLKSGHVQHVDNPHPNFFDISGVTKPADYIAYGNIASYLQKAASAEGRAVSGAEMAEWLGLADDTPSSCAKQLEALSKLAEAEVVLSATKTAAAWAFFAPADTAPPPIKLGSVRAPAAFAYLADQGLLLSLPTFLQMGDNEITTKQAQVLAETVSNYLPDTYSRMLHSPRMPELLVNNPYTAQDGYVPETVSGWAQKHAASCCMSDSAAKTRAQKRAIKGKKLLSKSASATAPNDVLQKLAEQYALYKLAFFAAQPATLTLTAQVLAAQNYNTL